MAQDNSSGLMRTLVVFETATERHVYELAAEGTETYENPLYNDRHRFGPLRLEVEGAILQHIVYDRTDGDDLVPQPQAIPRPTAQIEEDTHG